MNKELLNVLIKRLEKSIGDYDYYSKDGQILDKIEQLLNNIKVMNGEIPFEDWYLDEILGDKENE